MFNIIKEMIGDEREDLKPLFNEVTVLHKCKSLTINFIKLQNRRKSSLKPANSPTDFLKELTKQKLVMDNESTHRDPHESTHRDPQLQYCGCNATKASMCTTAMNSTVGHCILIFFEEDQ